MKVECLYKNLEIVKKFDEKILYKNDENVKILYKKCEISLQLVKRWGDDFLYKIDESVKNFRYDKPYNTCINYLPLLSKLLNLDNYIIIYVKKNVKDNTCRNSKNFNSIIGKYERIIKQENVIFDVEKFCE